MEHRACSILIVDDDPDIRAVLSLLLTSEGYTVQEATHGVAALELLPSDVQVGCILLDLRMPVMGGGPILDFLERDPILAHIPVIVMSGSPVGKFTAWQFGARAFLQKPFTAQAVIEVLEHVCGEATTEPL